uniref:DNA-directed DNA polymerase n=1 Tax=Rhodomonas sp. CCMP1178 TaxID=354588 RepID=A9LLA1_9CRYP|nr:DNA polymerase III gamma and tau subunits [Rhodomonas sp. CCMP1178]
MNKKYIPFHLKYRPQNFLNIIGQHKATQNLQIAIKKKKLTFAYLLIGQHGSGKTTLARVVAKALNCIDMKNIPCNICQNCINIHLGQSFDVYEIDAAKNTGIEHIRDVIERIQFTPIMGQYKVCIIDEAHMLSTSAFNSLLKTIESPPLNTIFILSTTIIHKIPNTIISRCQKIYLEPIRNQELTLAISKILHNEKIKITNQAMVSLLNLTKGSFRDALSIVETLCIDEKLITMADLTNKYKIPSFCIINSLFEKTCNSNLIDFLSLLDYIQFNQWDEDQIFCALYNNVVKSFISNNHNSYMHSQNLMTLLSQLLETKRSNKFNQFWIPLTTFVLENQLKKRKVEKKKYRKSLQYKKIKSEIYSN